jgi:hypothetical protein
MPDVLVLPDSIARRLIVLDDPGEPPVEVLLRLADEGPAS